MSIRSYPSEEGYKTPNGVPYVDLAENYIRKELFDYLGILKYVCHAKNITLVIISLNHGQHTGNSMHFKGLAIDFNLRDLNGWLPFDLQGNIAAQTADSRGFNPWIWASDLNTHSHLSLHPYCERGEGVYYPLNLNC